MLFLKKKKIKFLRTVIKIFRIIIGRTLTKYPEIKIGEY